ncbi:prepilin-type N-terminal cleavage/methylation domain-containing protein [Hydrogenivirga caldilitoris]|uniref:Prepilin-type N-terminal cleavage/methylation domain-containing protein n=1 Tax=Hydrogenivirga caldilitoris TaxID=246264 RepID=A0A497XPI4_9AQUI|nr:prepilin-type N-terminal cleavage/methylation domain-containing protein [Hydrogenivirga caldilitoris]RLJ70877.1 prepilin-type N-terminal cleavage/methylation domain-containing protein [Hydrogenivirga caldilitoris]
MKVRAFTLIEVLVVLTLLGLTFSALLLVFSRGIDSSLGITEESERLKLKASLFWDIQRKITGAKRIRVENNNLYMITSGGTIYRGVVKCAYIFKDGRLYYYEFPYPYGAIDEIEEDKLQRVATFHDFSIRVYERDREFNTYDGLPDRIKVSVEGNEMLFETLLR